MPQVKRYRKIAAAAETVYVFGVPDVAPPEIANVQYIHLKPDRPPHQRVVFDRAQHGLFQRAGD